MSSTEEQLARPHDDKGPMIKWVTIVMIIIGTVTMGLRLIARKMRSLSLDYEDYLMLAGWGLFLVYEALQLNCLRFGYGKHTVFVKDLEGFTKSLIVLEIFYNPPIICIKASILILYNRLFASRKLKIFSWVLWVIVFCYSMALMIAEIFECVPFAYSWDKTIKGGKCIDLAAAVFTCGIINTVTDFVIISLPVPFLWKLQISLTRRLQLIVIFLCGGFVCFVSVYRNVLVLQVNYSDPSWSDVQGSLWSGIELAIALVCGNLPVLRPIYNKIFARHQSTNSDPQSQSNMGKGTGKRTQGKAMPSLRPEIYGTNTLVTHGQFERLGRSVDSVSLEMQPLKNQGASKGSKGDNIMVTTHIDQEYEVDQKTEKNFT